MQMQCQAMPAVTVAATQTPTLAPSQPIRHVWQWSDHVADGTKPLASVPRINLGLECLSLQSQHLGNRTIVGEVLLQEYMPPRYAMPMQCPPVTYYYQDTCTCPYTAHQARVAVERPCSRWHNTTSKCPQNKLELECLGLR